MDMFFIDMKKLKITGGCIILLLLFSGNPLSGIELGFKLSGGYAYLNLKNTNRSLDDWAEWKKREAEANKNWAYLGENVKNLHSGIHFEGEFLVSLIGRFELGLGTGYIYGDLNEEKTEVLVQRPAESISHVYPLTISAYPLVLSAYYSFPLKSGISLFIRAGGGIAWAKYVNREAQKLESSAKYNYFKLEKASASGSMVLGGIGFAFETDAGMRFFIEGIVRRAKIQGFTGENELEEKGILYHFEEYIPDLDFWQTKNEIRAERPSGSNYRSVSEALVDFSGFSVKIGFMVRF
jgi:opacity protein-like surface antigen